MDISNNVLDVISQKKDYYTMMASMCDDILSGQSIKQVCSKNSISLPVFRGRLFRNELKSSQITKEELEVLSRNFMSPEERILRDVIAPHIRDISKSKTLAEIQFAEDFEKTMEAVINENFDDRMKEVINLYYYENWPYAKVADQLQVSLERVRQIHFKILRRFRRSDTILRLIYGDTKYTEYVKDVKTYHYIQDLFSHLRNVKMKSEKYQKFIQQFGDMLSFDFEEATIESLDLDIRTYNCLKRKKINFVDELLKLTDDDLLSIPKFGQSSLQSLDQTLADKGLCRESNKEV